MSENERAKRESTRRLLINYLYLRELLPRLIKDTSFTNYQIKRVYDADKTALRSIIIFFDNKCRISISQFFVCGVRIEKKTKGSKSVAFAKGKNLELDLTKCLTDLGFKS